MSKLGKLIASELEHHIPFTFFGAATGILLIVVLLVTNTLMDVVPISEDVFFILHPTHIFFSAIVTTSLYLKYSKKNIWLAILIGYTGSIGIATISDSLIPYLGEILLKLPNPGAHIGFIEEPLLVNIPAFIGIALGYFRGFTRFPHAAHVMISTWASLFHIMIALNVSITQLQVIGIFVFLFLAVWLPCCTSDIIYPLIFPKAKHEHI
ncbi:MAG: hypothetical protein KKC68_04640 [Candidatus Thermoplasmatota archaeon]|nr:hypothetical protein [Candidatus Thermoplasmatota archaeon]MBU1941039.1 hypothetical protein [Candidatus Thermoplasmatota archaeon]